MEDGWRAAAAAARSDLWCTTALAGGGHTRTCTAALSWCECPGVLEFLSLLGFEEFCFVWGNFYVAFWHLAGGVTLLGLMLWFDDASTTCTGAAQ